MGRKYSIIRQMSFLSGSAGDGQQPAIAVWKQAMKKSWYGEFSRRRPRVGVGLEYLEHAVGARCVDAFANAPGRRTEANHAVAWQVGNTIEHKAWRITIAPQDNTWFMFAPKGSREGKQFNAMQPRPMRVLPPRA